MARAEIAQSVEQLSRNQQVVGSIPIFGTIFRIIYFLRKTIDVRWSFVFYGQEEWLFFDTTDKM